MSMHEEMSKCCIVSNKEFMTTVFLIFTSNAIICTVTQLSHPSDTLVALMECHREMWELNCLC